MNLAMTVSENNIVIRIINKAINQGYYIAVNDENKMNDLNSLMSLLAKDGMSDCISFYYDEHLPTEFGRLILCYGQGDDFIFMKLNSDPGFYEFMQEFISY